MTTAAADGADTIVLIHGLWMTPLCWEHWVERYTCRGYSVIAPSWPGVASGIERLRRHPQVLAGLGVSEITQHYENIVRELRRPPILIGHSFGGAFVQLLLDRGLGAAGVAIHSAPVRGVFTLPLSTLRASFPVLRDPRNAWRAVPLTPKQFHYAFTNTLSEHESAGVYDRYHIPGPGRVLFQAALANLNPQATTRVDFNNARRPPLLLISGGVDRVVPAAVNHENFRRYTGAAVTGYKEFPDRSHYTLGQEGWEEVADYAIDWVTQQLSPGGAVPELTSMVRGRSL